MSLTLTRAVVEILGDNAHLRKTLADSASQMEDAGRRLQSVGKRMTMSVTAPLAAIGGASVKAFADFDSAMTQSLAIMGDVSGAMRTEMVDAARQVATTTTLSSTKAAESYFFLASAGLDAAQSVAALPQVAAFAQAGMFDMATATDLATDAQSALGLTVDDAQQNLQNMTRVTDVLVKANTLANATVQQFSESLTNEAGAAMKTFGIDIEEGVAVLAAFADQGIKGQVAGSGFSRILRLMSQAAVNNKEEMQDLGLSFFDATGDMRPMADIVEQLTGVLGEMSDEQRAAALESIGFTARVQGIIQPLLGTSDAIREYQAGLEDAGGTTAEVADNQMKSFSAQLTVMKNQMGIAAQTLGELLAPLVLVLAEDLTKVVGAFTEMSPVMQGAIVTLGGLAAAAGPVLFAVGTLVKTLPLLKLGFGALSAPVLLGVAAFASMAAAGHALIENWGTIKFEVQKLWEGIKEAFTGGLNSVVDWTKDKIGAVTGVFKGMYDAVVGNSYVPDMVDEIEVEFRRMEDIMRTSAEKATSFTTLAFHGMVGVIENVLDETFGEMKAFNEQIEITVFDNLKPIEDWGRAGEQSAEDTEEAWEKALSGISRQLGSLGSQVEQFGVLFMEAFEDARDAGEDLFSSISSGLEAGAGSLVGMGAGLLVQGIGGVLGGIFGGGPSEEEQRQMREALQGLTKELAGFRNELRQGDLSPIQESVSGIADRVEGLLVQFAEAFDPGMVDQFELFSEVVAEKGNDVAAIMEWLAVQAQWVAESFGDNALAMAKFRQIMELATEAARQAAEAELERLRALRRSLTNEFTLREARVFGDDERAARLEREMAAREEIRRLEELAEAGDITAKQLQKWTRIIELELNKALEEAARQAQETARRFREDLAVRGLQAVGHGVEAQRLGMRFSQRREILDAIKEGLGGSEIELLRGVQGIEREAFEAGVRMDRQIEAVRAQTEQQVAVLEEQKRVAESHLATARDQLSAQQRTVDDIRRVLDTLDQFGRDLVLGDFSPLSSSRRLDEARAQFEAMRSLALGGDVTAAQSLPDAARNLLEASEAFFASGPGFVSQFEFVQDTLAAVRERFRGQLTVEEQILAELKAQTQRLQAQVNQMGARIQQAQSQANAQIAEIRKAHQEEMNRLFEILQELLKQTDKLGAIQTIIPPPGGGGGTPNIPLNNVGAGPMEAMEQQQAQANQAHLRALATLDQRLVSLEETVATQGARQTRALEGAKLRG